MTTNVPQSDLNRQINSLTERFLPNANTWQTTAANTLLQAVIHGGDTLVNRIASFVKENKTSAKGTCERGSDSEDDLNAFAKDFMVDYSIRIWHALQIPEIFAKFQADF